MTGPGYRTDAFAGSGTTRKIIMPQTVRNKILPAVWYEGEAFMTLEQKQAVALSRYSVIAPLITGTVEGCMSHNEFYQQTAQKEGHSPEKDMRRYEREHINEVWYGDTSFNLAPLFIAHTARAAFLDQSHPFCTVSVYLSLRHLHRPPIMILECLTTILPDRL